MNAPQIGRVDIEHVASVARFYRPGAVFGDPHTATIYITWQTPQQVLLGAATGRLARSDLRALAEALLDQGIETIQAYRAKGAVVPGGILIQGGEQYDLWQVDLVLTLAAHPNPVPGDTPGRWSFETCDESDSHITPKGTPWTGSNAS
ncbi:MAG: hypothetical protein JWL63_3224 [Rhodocyclales bacterium]|nr:hypothetical protein [Rhodocyclales bacterium]